MRLENIYLILSAFVLVVLTSCFDLNSDRVYCGMDDGPFSAEKIIIPFDSIGIDSFEISNGKLFVQNILVYSMPVLSLVEENKIIWSLLMDPNYDEKDNVNYSMSEMKNLEIIRSNNTIIKIRFNCIWTYGGEVGTMMIDRKTGENSYCLSW